MPHANGQPYRYEVVTAVVLDTPIIEADPHRMAAEVLRRDPGGNYEPYRICVDIRRIVEASDQFTDRHISMTAEQRQHAAALRDHMKRNGTWTTTRHS